MSAIQFHSSTQVIVLAICIDSAHNRLFDNSCYYACAEVCAACPGTAASACGESTLASPFAASSNQSCSGSVLSVCVCACVCVCVRVCVCVCVCVFLV